jgi:Ca2+-binding EF-hand superfamily protein
MLQPATKTAPSAASDDRQPPLASTSKETTQKKYLRKIYDIRNGLFIREDVNEEEFESAKSYFCAFLDNLSQETNRGDDHEKLRWAYETLYMNADSNEETEDVLTAIKYAERIAK